ncbi:DNA-binding response regulator [Actinomadura sp. DSM 109109]|nr:DNA-binding response regulator [Actinomadura lepetitiana]
MTLSGDGKVAPPRRAEVRDAVGQALEESGFYASRGLRPPTRRVDPPKVGAVVARLADATRRELLTFDDPSGCLRQGVPERMLRHAADCVRRAVTQVPSLRQITSPQGLAQDSALETIQWRNGGQVRLVERIPVRLAVFDRTTAIIPLDLDVFYNGLLIVRDPAVVGAMVRLHRHSWGSGDALPAGGDPDLPPAHLVPVLACMRDGLSDGAAAVRLGLSARTYARRVSELLALLGTTSRFQAAITAQRRGWI